MDVHARYESIGDAEATEASYGSRHKGYNDDRDTGKLQLRELNLHPNTDQTSLGPPSLTFPHLQTEKQRSKRSRPLPTDAIQKAGSNDHTGPVVGIWQTLDANNGRQTIDRL